MAQKTTSKKSASVASRGKGSAKGAKTAGAALAQKPGVAKRGKRKS